MSDLVEINALQPGRAQLLTNLKGSSFAIGEKGAGLARVTEAAQQYANPNIPSNATDHSKAQNKELRQYLKGHHFDLGSKSGVSLQLGGPSAASQAEASSFNQYTRSVQDKFKKD